MEEEHHQQQEQASSAQSTAQPTEPPPPQQQQQQPQPTTSSSSSILSPSLQSTPNPNNPTIIQSQSQQLTTSQNSLPRPSFGRPWQPPISSSLSLHPNFPSSSPVPPHSSSGLQRGGMAIGVPASAPPSSFSSMNPPSFNQPFGGLARASVNFPEASPSSSTTSQVRQPMQGMGMMGSLGSSSSLRPSGVNAPHPQRPIQSSPRPQGGSVSQSPAAQNFQGPGIIRAPSVGSPGSPSPNASQSSQPHNQPWLSSGSQGKPPLPPPSYRPQMNPQSLQQRSNIPQQQQPPPQQQLQQQQHTISTAAQQYQTSSPQSQPPALLQQSQEQYSMPQPRIPQSLAHQQQIARGRGLGKQKPSSQPIGQFSGIQASTFNKTAATAETGESCNRILSKRSIQELVMQVDPSERLDPEVEDILVDLADEFVESITTFGCSLAKHRKSNTLEAKDILLHLERTWNMTLPGFSGDEIKIYKKPSVNETHKERLAAIKRTITAAETINSKGSAGQAAGGNAKSHPAKAPGLSIGSPNPKVRETA